MAIGHRFGLLALIGLLLTQTSQACSPAIPPAPRYVGNTSTDPACTDSSIQAAIDNVACPGTRIILTPEITYTAQHVTIQDKSVSLIGSVPGTRCGFDGGSNPGGGAPITTPQIVVDGAGHTGDSVISIKGNSNVTLQYLEIKDGQEQGSDSHGGGLYFNGTGSLTLQADTVDNNAAGKGAGIYFKGTSSATQSKLVLQNNVLVLNNTAQTSGGGVYIEGNSRMLMIEPASTISFNKALGSYGGGIEVTGPARVDIASSGVVITGALSFNTAPRGGGIAVFGDSGGAGEARFFTTDASAPVLINNNSATEQGGAVFLDPDTNDIKGAFVCAYDFRIEGNIAPDGAVVYGNSPNGSVYANGAFFNSSQCGPETTASLGGVACAAGTVCNEISGNAAQDSDGTLDGAVINMDHNTAFNFDRTVMRQNAGGHLLNLHGGFYENALMNNCLLVDNHSSAELIVLEMLYAPYTIDSCTIANNTVEGSAVISAKNGLQLTHDLIYQFNTTLDYVFDDPAGNSDCDVANCLITSYDIANDINSLHSPTFSLQSTAPLFVDKDNSDPSKRDYHLLAYLDGSGTVVASPAIDFAAAVPGSENDLDGNPRDLSVPAVVNRFGPRDVGAYEMQPIADRVFGNSFGDAVFLVDY